MVRSEYYIVAAQPQQCKQRCCYGAAKWRELKSETRFHDNCFQIRQNMLRAIVDCRHITGSLSCRDACTAKHASQGWNEGGRPYRARNESNHSLKLLLGLSDRNKVTTILLFLRESLK